MSHLALKQSYKSLSDRLNLFPKGAPPAELLFRILQVDPKHLGSVSLTSPLNAARLRVSC